MTARSTSLTGGSRMLAEAVLRNGAELTSHTERLQAMLAANERCRRRIQDLVAAFRKDAEDTAIYLRVIEKNLAENSQRMPMRGVR
jgi:hypothetical protein